MEGSEYLYLTCPPVPPRGPGGPSPPLGVARVARTEKRGRPRAKRAGDQSSEVLPAGFGLSMSRPGCQLRGGVRPRTGDALPGAGPSCPRGPSSRALAAHMSDLRLQIRPESRSRDCGDEPALPRWGHRCANIAREEKLKRIARRRLRCFGEAWWPWSPRCGKTARWTTDALARLVEFHVDAGTDAIIAVGNHRRIGHPRPRRAPRGDPQGHRGGSGPAAGDRRDRSELDHRGAAPDPRRRSSRGPTAACW